MDKLKKGFAWFLLVFFTLMFQIFYRGSYWFTATIATLGLFANICWLRRLKHPRHSLSLH
ncbi:MAG: hypothetical protein WAO35_25270 [Terriglobia bacterium]